MSDDDNVSVVEALFVSVSQPLIEIVFGVGQVTSIHAIAFDSEYEGFHAASIDW